MKISIITIVYNRQDLILDCLESVLGQSYANIEYIVIDGGSTDGTQEKIENYKDKLAYYISEKDNGLYDALNKGINQATGDVVGILNSDDIFYDRNTIQKIADAFYESGSNLVYAKGLFVTKEDTNKIKRKYPSSLFQKSYLKYGWIPLHTTIFVKRDIFLRYGLYDLDYAIASDYEISLRWFKNNKIKKFFLDEWVVKMRLGGLSTNKKLQLKKSKEDLKIIKLYKLNGLFTLACKIGRKLPQYIAPHVESLLPEFPRSQSN